MVDIVWCKPNYMFLFQLLPKTPVTNETKKHVCEDRKRRCVTHPWPPLPSDCRPSLSSSKCTLWTIAPVKHNDHLCITKFFYNTFPLTHLWQFGRCKIWIYKFTVLLVQLFSYFQIFAAGKKCVSAVRGQKQNCMFVYWSHCTTF